MNQIFYITFFLLLFLLTCPLAGQDIAHTSDRADMAKSYIRSHLEDLSLTSDDIREMVITDMYLDSASGITRVYFQQQHQGIPVYNAILNVCISREGVVFFTGNRFVADLVNKINTTKPSLKAEEAVMRLASHLGLPRETLILKKQTGDAQYDFTGGILANEDITVKLCYQPLEEEVLLAWDILIEPAGKDDKWNTRIDALTGVVLDETNWTIYCATESHLSHEEELDCHENSSLLVTTDPTPSNDASYHVWPAPLKNPLDGPRMMTSNPWDTIASPYGWHDINGVKGPEFSITRGNNVHAFQDRQNTGKSSNDEPDGGMDMIFDFPFNAESEPEEQVQAAVVNLYYWVNYMHDFSYRFGFTEAAGNYQQNNYGKGGIGQDPVMALVQQGAETGKKNNAFFQSNLEGTSGTMSMYVFDLQKHLMTITEPAEIAGRHRTSLPSAGWGPGAYVTDIPVTGEVIRVNDGIEEPYASDACEEIQNAEMLSGKIAFIDRGGCEFGWKVLQAQNAGAIGVIICNFDDDNYTMNPGNYGASVHIPVIMIGISTGQSISQYVGNGLIVSLVNSSEDIPQFLDSDFDNSIIAHEYGHGISVRLVGGPHTFCLDNEENLGEGWSDFISLVNTVKPGDSGEMKTGFATYSTRNPFDGRGYRRYPYSTDMSIMPLTYADVAANIQIHNIGEAWGAMLWDMYWALVEKYGWSEDLYDESSGNYKAIKLVFEGMKNAPCNPGFVDGRDAILAAEESLYGGEDFCLLWEVFARRGLGYSANQGSPYDAGDQIAAFDLPPACMNQIVITKSVTDFIQPGDDIIVTIKVGNFKKEPVSGIVVSDEIVDGTTYRMNASPYEAHLENDQVLFDVGDMNAGEEIIIRYFMSSSSSQASQRVFIDSLSEAQNNNWIVSSIGSVTSNAWVLDTTYPAHSGNYCWFADEINERGRQALELNPAVYTHHVNGVRPALRFYHRYHTRSARNGGIIEVKDLNGSGWETVNNDMIRNGYSGVIDYRTFTEPNLKAFSGKSSDTLEATYVDLSKWTGQDIQIRFLFGTVEDASAGFGWLIDDIEFMDLLNYNSEACIMSDQGDFECAFAPEGGTIVDSRQNPVSGMETLDDMVASIYPNPASDELTLLFAEPLNGNIDIRLVSADGKAWQSNSFDAYDKTALHFDINHVPTGIYYVEIFTASGTTAKKVIIQQN